MKFVKIKRLLTVLSYFFFEWYTPHDVRLIIFYIIRRIDGNTHMKPAWHTKKHEMLWLYVTQ